MITRRNAIASLLALVAALALAACGGAAPTPTAAPTPAADTPTVAQPAAAAPTADRAAAAPTPTTGSGAETRPANTPTAEQPDAQSSASDSTSASATEPPASLDPPAAFSRSTGEVEGARFVVGAGSKATFSVDEELANLAVPNYEAVLETEELSGEVRLDGGGSLVTVGLHRMTSDQEYRDRYVQRRMFPNQPTAEVAFGDLTPLPDGFTAGELVTASVDGTLRINGIDVPLTFEIRARDDGNLVYVWGGSSFTWDDIQEPVPTARSVVSVGDTVRVEVLLALTPMAG